MAATLNTIATIVARHDATDDADKTMGASHESSIAEKLSSVVETITSINEQPGATAETHHTPNILFRYNGDEDRSIHEGSSPRRLSWDDDDEDDDDYASHYAGLGLKATRFCPPSPPAVSAALETKTTGLDLSPPAADDSGKMNKSRLKQPPSGSEEPSPPPSPWMALAEGEADKERKRSARNLAATKTDMAQRGLATGIKSSPARNTQVAGLAYSKDYYDAEEAGGVTQKKLMFDATSPISTLEDTASNESSSPDDGKEEEEKEEDTKTKQMVQSVSSMQSVVSKQIEVMKEYVIAVRALSEATSKLASAVTSRSQSVRLRRARIAHQHSLIERAKFEQACGNTDAAREYFRQAHQLSKAYLESTQASTAAASTDTLSQPRAATEAQP
eukprot:CAMPEP_0113470764 /NCGR_PEP_ID=MMETSP0014_2-20120614/16620_1 /TAXON_ID=2857 /ORGANISM="Nitzschia sp." /LENGTH=388 /DNA_ID=CAMNT_0000363357 /DNA_START=64 /DNA_END=1226 /DNA_ORIENTATION=+ /assembly_acc=CAM_ASM_000159